MTGADRSSDTRGRAAEWVVRSQAHDFGAEDWRALHAWLAEDPSHADAFNEMEAVWVDLDDPAAKPGPSAEIIAFTPRPRARAPIAWLPAGATAAVRSPLAWLSAAAAAAVVAMVATTGVLRQAAPPPMQTAAYRTGPGERRNLVLQDGTRLALNGATRIQVSFGGGKRQVVMPEGEAAFEVAHDKAHPFVIDLGERRVEVVGTEFNILREPSRLVVTVKQGVVAVAASAADVHPVRLTAGRQLVHQTGESGQTVSKVDPTAAYGWRSGRLSYSAAPLSDVAEDLGRYFGKTVEVDPEVRALTFTGVLNLDGEQAVFNRLEMFLPIRAEVSASGVRLARGVQR